MTRINCLQRGDYTWSKGDEGYLIRVKAPHKREYHVMRDEPPLTNMSREARPEGWCGNTNGTDIYGCGRARVVGVREGGDLLIVESIEEADQ